MKKDWTEIMRDKLSQSAVTPPDDLWAGISSDLDAISASNHKTVRPAIWRWAAVAASVAVLLVCGLYFYEFNKDTNFPKSQGGGAAGSQQLTANINVISKEGHDTPTVNNAIDHKSNIHKVKVTADAGQQPKSDDLAQTADNIADRSLVTEDLAFDVDDNHSHNAFPDTSVVDDIDYEKLLMAQIQDVKLTELRGKHPRHLSLSLFASNTNIPNNELNGEFEPNYGNISSEYPPFGSEDDKHSNSGSAESRSSDSNSVKDVRHKQPVRFGLSARIPVSQSFSISTGITYSLLTSTITMANHNNMTFDVDQTLLYIGVPVSIDYNLPSYRSVSFYLTAGTMIEKCIHGKSRVSNSPFTDGVNERRLQLSIFAGAGMQIDLNEHIAMYAEPLATYYFDNHSGISNIYKDRPLNLDLRVGLRYTFR